MTDIPVWYKQTEVGIIPNNWEVKQLWNISTIVTGSTPTTRDSSNYWNDYFFVWPWDLWKTKIIKSVEKKLSKKWFSISRKYPKGSILYTCIGSTIWKVWIAPIELTSNQQINAIFPNATFF